MQHSALILDGTQKSALAVVRALGQRGVSVVTAAVSPGALASWSQYSSEFQQYPCPKADLEGFLGWLETYADQCDTPPVVYAFSDATHLALARQRSRLEEKVLFAWNQSVLLEQAFSKRQTYELARTLGVPTIPELHPDKVTEFPVVLKPYTSVSWATGTGRFGTAEFAFSATEYSQLRRQILTTTGAEPIVQRFLLGDEYGVTCLVHAGKVEQQTVHRRVRSLSPRGGASVVKEIAPPTELTGVLCQSANQLLQELQWIGPAMVEFKVDNKTEEPVLMEINGRFCGSLPLLQAAGVDFVGGYYDLLTTGTVSLSHVQPRQVRTQHFLGDVKHLLSVWFRRDQLRTQLYPSRLGALWRFLVDTALTRGDVFLWRDPWPMYGEVISIRNKQRWNTK